MLQAKSGPRVQLALLGPPALLVLPALLVPPAPLVLRAPPVLQRKAVRRWRRGGPSSRVRVVRANCNATACSAQCDPDEALLIAYCGVGRNTAVYPTERSASCRARTPANNPLVIACMAQ